MGLFSKKKGGTFFGNLIAKVANQATGGLLGARRVAAMQSGDLASINPDAKTEGKMLTSMTSFAGQPATQSADGTINMSNPLKEVSIQGTRPNVVDGFIEKLGDKLSYLGNRTSENTKFGIDDNTKWLIGGGIALVAIAIIATKK